VVAQVTKTPKKDNRHRVTVRPEVYARLQAVATQKGVSVSYLINGAIESYLQQLS